MSEKISRAGPNGMDMGLFTAGVRLGNENAKSDTCEDSANSCQVGECGSRPTKTCCQAVNEPPAMDDWAKALCYGCRITLLDVVSIALYRFITTTSYINICFFVRRVNHN